MRQNRFDLNIGFYNILIHLIYLTQKCQKIKKLLEFESRPIWILAIVIA